MAPAKRLIRTLTDALQTITSYNVRHSVTQVPSERKGQDDLTVKSGASILGRPPRYRAFLLRCYEADSATWRFTLEDSRTGERQGFADLEALIAFLRDMMDEGESQSTATET